MTQILAPILIVHQVQVTARALAQPRRVKKAVSPDQPLTVQPVINQAVNLQNQTVLLAPENLPMPQMLLEASPTHQHILTGPDLDQLKAISRGLPVSSRMDLEALTKGLQGRGVALEGLDPVVQDQAVQKAGLRVQNQGHRVQSHGHRAQNRDHRVLNHVLNHQNQGIRQDHDPSLEVAVQRQGRQDQGKEVLPLGLRVLWLGKMFKIAGQIHQIL